MIFFPFQILVTAASLNTCPTSMCAGSFTSCITVLVIKLCFCFVAALNLTNELEILIATRAIFKQVPAMTGDRT